MSRVFAGLGIIAVGMIVLFFVSCERITDDKQIVINSVQNPVSESFESFIAPGVAGFISPHHLLADDMIDNIFEQVSKDDKKAKIDLVVLISPNHFHTKGGSVMISDTNLNDKTEIIDALSGLDFVYLNNKPFEKEHGINNLLPFVNKYFADVLVLSVMIEEGTNKDKMEELADKFGDSKLFENALFVLSSDFSHELTPDLSEIHDQVAISTIANFDFDNVYNLDTDCVEGLFLLMKIMQHKNYNNFEFVANSNSSQKYKNYFVGENTSYVTGKFVKDNKKNQKKKHLTSLMFGGDVMLDRDTKNNAKKLGITYFTKQIKRLFWSQDINMFNLEGPVTDNKSVSNVLPTNPNHFKFTFDPDLVREFLSYNRINFVSIGNNHILNFGETGLGQTQDFLGKFDIDYIGVPKEESEKNILYKTYGDKTIAFVSYNDFAPPSFEKTLVNIRTAKTGSDFVIVYAHWGREYYKQMTQSQIQRAHDFLDAGANIVVGSHPHVIEPVEIYNNKIIFYSLGNFVFDQYFSEDVRERLVLNLLVDWREREISFVLTPVYANEFGQLSLADAEKRKQILSEIVQNSLLENQKQKEDLKRGVVEMSF